MKNNLSIKSKFSKILVCTLLVAFIFQNTAISMVQATSETVPEDIPVRQSPNNAVVPNDDSIIIAPKDPVLISTEDGEVITPEESRPIQPSSDDTVVVSRDDPVIIASDDPVIIHEGGEIITPENSTTTNEEIERTVPDDCTTIGVDDENSEEDYQPLITPQPLQDNISAILSVGIISAAIAVVAVVFFSRRSKKISLSQK